MANESSAPHIPAIAELPKLPASMTLLLEEYKLVQGKVDKLGEDKFKVRSWCLTLITGVLAGGKLSGALETSWATALVLLFLVLVVMGFELVELRQKEIANRLGLRAQQIELIWRRQLEKPDPKSTSTPQLATSLVKQARREKRELSLRKWVKRRLSTVRTWSKSKFRRATTTKTAEPQAVGPSRKMPNDDNRVRLIDCLVARSDRLFYVVQYLVLLSSLTGIAIYKIWQSLSPGRAKTEQQSLILRVGTNDFHLGVARTNITVTNFVQVVLPSTNFVAVTRLTTNFVVTNIIVTNAISQPPVTQSKAP